jgi:hypothetical protein
VVKHPSEGAGTCSECGRHYAFLRQHERKIHGKYKRRPSPEEVEQMRANVAIARSALQQSQAEARANGNRPPARWLPAEVQQARPTESPVPTEQTFRVMPFVVLEDQDGHIWIAERIK